VSDNGTTVPARIQVTAGGTTINIKKNDGTNFAVSTNLTAVYGEIVFPTTT
jgi:hypothetical protein